MKLACPTGTSSSKAPWQGFRVLGFACHAAGFRCKNTCKLHIEMVLMLHIRSDREYFFDLTGTEGKDRSKTSIYRKFGCQLYLLQYDSTLRKTFHSNVFSEKWHDTEKTKKKSEKRELVKDKWYNQMGQVGTSWSRGTSGAR